MRRRGARRRGVVTVLALASLTVGGYALARSSLFGIDRIEVVGTAQRDAVIAASGLRPGQNVLGLDLAVAEARVEELPMVSDARVERAGALGVRIVVVERRAVLEVREGGRRWFLDARGERIVADVPWGRLPVLVVRGVAAERIGDVLAVWRALPPSVRASIGSFELVGGSVAFDVGGTHVVFGGAERVSEKLRALALVRDRVEREGRVLVEVDVRAPWHPAARTRRR